MRQQREGNGNSTKYPKVCWAHLKKKEKMFFRFIKVLCVKTNFHSQSFPHAIKDAPFPSHTPCSQSQNKTKFNLHCHLQQRALIMMVQKSVMFFFGGGGWGRTAKTRLQDSPAHKTHSSFWLKICTQFDEKCTENFPSVRHTPNVWSHFGTKDASCMRVITAPRGVPEIARFQGGSCNPC